MAYASGRWPKGKTFFFNNTCQECSGEHDYGVMVFPIFSTAQAQRLAASLLCMRCNRRRVDANFPRCFPVITLPPLLTSVSIHRFEIKDDAPRLRSINRDPFAGWACIRLDRLMSGYRFIKLFDAKGNETQGCLLVSIIKQFQ